jgi:serine/threonine-protein kinase
MSSVPAMSEAAVLACFDELLDLALADRERRLQAIAVENPSLHARLQRMLAAATNTTGPLAHPIVDVMRKMRTAVMLPAEPHEGLFGYRLLRALGRSGMASVWLAERSDGRVKRHVALKLPGFALRSALDIARFEQERDVLASLAHRRIARLYDADVTPGGQPFIVLEFIDGVPITTYCDSQRLCIQQRLELFLQVLAAVDHGHQHMIAHGDLKPSNILVAGEGQVKLLDFGIAKLLAAPAGTSMPHTQQDTAAPMLRYLAPEQVAQLPISTLTDVYVLGLVLHELLTGVPPAPVATDTPFSLEQILRAQLPGCYCPPSKAALTDGAARARHLPSAGVLRQALKGDLDAIVRKALRQAPEQRYGSTQQFANDLRRFLQRRPITARPARWHYVAGLFLRRHRVASISVACGALISMVAVGAALYQHLESRTGMARTAAVGNFMVSLFDDTEPGVDQADRASRTVNQMLDAAVLRAQQDFRLQPQLRGEVLSEIGRIYLRGNELERSERTLNEALRLLSSSAPSDDTTLNRTRAQLAFVALTHNDIVRAHELATLARDNCTARNAECAKVQAHANSSLSQIHAAQGRAAASLAAMRQSVDDTIRGFGAAHAETALALTSFAILARNHGQLRTAGSAMQRAAAIANLPALRAQNRQRILRADAVIKLDLGRYEAAREQLGRLLTATSQPTERAMLLRLQASVAFEQGSLNAAEAAAREAASLVDPQDHTPELMHATQILARIHALRGQTNQALIEIQTVLDGLIQARMPSESGAVLRAQRVRAEILLRGGNLARASAELEALAARLRRMPSASDVELGQVLDLWGSALRGLGRSAESVAIHDAARVALQKQLSGNHPWLQRNALYREAAAGNWDSFDSRAQQLVKALVPGSVWKRMLDAHANSLECRSSTSRSCLIVL